MKFSQLDFKEIDDNRTQAAIHLDRGFNIQIIYNAEDRLYEANLYNPEGSILDSDSGMDKEAVEGFIEDSKDLIEEYKEIMGNCLVLS